MATAAVNLRFGFLQQWMTLLGVLKYGVAFCALLVFLPLAAVDVTPHHSLLGGLFIDLSPLAVFFVAIALVSATWSAMYGVGLIVNGIELCFDRTGRACRPLAEIVERPTGFVPAWAEVFFTVPVTPPQLVFFTVVALPGLWAVVWHSTSPGFAVVAAVLGVVVAYIGMLLVCTPAALVDRDNAPLSGLPLAGGLWHRLATGEGRIPRLARAVSTLLWRIVTAVCWRLFVRYAISETDGVRRLHSSHFVAALAVALLAAVILGTPVFFAPGAVIEFPALLYLYVILMLLIWTVTGLHFYIGRHRLSILAAILLVIILGYQVFDADHAYHVEYRPLGPPVAAPAGSLRPVDTVIAGPNERNLVVVAASGGGILAAGWTTLVLEELVAKRPAVATEIRLLSTISGGSVGAAYVIDALRGLPKSADARQALSDARVRAMTGSLEAAAYGFAFLDFPRLLLGGASLQPNDRGHMIEREWARTAAGRVDHSTATAPIDRVADASVAKAPLPPGVPAALRSPTLMELRAKILEGRIPAMIFGATIMESGRRLMITPVDFIGIPAGERPLRATTLSEQVFGADGQGDLSLWTAARLSATFAFVTPAAKAALLPPDPRAPRPRGSEHHLIDGGYYDNFGVTSALDWLDPVLKARQRDEPVGKTREGGDVKLRFQRVLILQLRAFRRGRPEDLRPASGAYSALFGPLIGLGAIRDGVASSRNDIDLERFIDTWNARLAEHRVKLCTVAVEPPPGPRGPLSWHLTRDDKRAVYRAFDRLEREAGILDAVDRFLDERQDGDCPTPKPPTP